MGFFSFLNQSRQMIYQIEAQGTRNTNIPSISLGVTGGGRNLARKWLSKGNLQESTKPCTILRKGAHFRNLQLKTLEKSPTSRRKTRRKPANLEEEPRLETSPIRRTGASDRRVDGAVGVAGDWRSSLAGASAPVAGGGGGATSNSQLPWFA